MTSPAADDADESLAARAASGDAAAFTALVRRYAVRVVAFLRRSCGLAAEAAEDAAQETWLKVWRALPAWEADHFRGWLFTVARRTAFGHAAKDARRNAAPLAAAAHVTARGAPVGADAEAADVAARLAGCRDKLPPDLRTAFEGFVGGRADDDLAAEAGIDAGTVRSRRSKARKLLRTCMGVDAE